MRESDTIDIEHLLRQSPLNLKMVWSVAAGVIALGFAFFSVASIEPGEAGVRVNNVTGTMQDITQPGWVVALPGLHSLHVLDAAPQTFTMRGEADEDLLTVRELTVRASDGSNFHFDDVSLIFQLQPSQAIRAVTDAGPDDGFKQWLRPFARSVLRDEFGRESTLDVSNPTTYAAATNRARARLNEVLEPHGVTVTQLVTPRPRFNEDYERAIEERNRLGNEISVIKSKLERAETDRARALAEVNQTKNKEIQVRRASLESELAQSLAAQAQRRQEVDTARIAAIGEGQASLSAARQQARELEGQLSAEYAARKAEIEAFRNQSVERVMQRLGDKLKNVTVDIIPFSNDANPSTLNVKQN
ncbi:MAG: SPFH domain-containing protein [Nannocystaceae bacterium]